MRVVSAALKNSDVALDEIVYLSAHGTGTDANVMQLSRAGVATALVEIPLRYMHTSAEVLSLTDVENAASLITAFLIELDGKTNWIPS